jgi:hypothetical protein
MTRTKLILSIAVMSCLLLPFPVHSQEPGGHAGVRARLVEAALDVKMHQLELKVAELGVNEATIEIEKIKLHFEAAKEQEDSREAAHLNLELKQAAIRVEVRKVESEMARFRIELAKTSLEHLRATLSEKPKKRTRVQLEYIDDVDSDIVVIRGAKRHVEKIKALIESAEKHKKERE